MTSTKREYPADRLKKIKYRAHHRGTQEMDIILGGFVDNNITGFSSLELDDLESLMNEADADLYNWIIGKDPIENSPFPELTEQIALFQQSRVAAK